MVEDPSDRATSERQTSLHIQRAIQNDRESVAWLISRVTPLLLCQTQQRLSPSLRRFYDPEDIVAEVWMRVLPALPRLAPANGSLSLGLIRFASTVLIRRLRDLLEKHVLNKPPMNPLPETGESTTNLPADTRGVITHVVAEEHRGQVWASLAALSPQDREIVVLRGIEGRPHDDIAALVGLSPEHVAVRYHRALKRLRDQIPSSIFHDLED
jgi:RNA polymerase sigma factor (sigma-70 family)